MFTKPLTRAPWYKLIKSFFLAIGRSYLHDLSPTFLKRLKHYEVKLHVKSASFSTDNGQTSRFSFFYRISNDKNFIPKYLDNALTVACENIRFSLFFADGDVSAKSEEKRMFSQATLTDSVLTSRTLRRPYWRKKLLWSILEEQFPERKIAASIIGNGFISLL